MHIFIEAWNANDTWRGLSADERRAYMDQIEGAIAQMAEAGITTLGWGVNDDDTPMRADYDFVAVWQADSLDAIKALEAGVEAAGWYTYFDQVNVRSELRPAADVIADHVAL
ncbi:MAG: DUF6616 family protein [Actinomycetota bacterium]